MDIKCEKQTIAVLSESGSYSKELCRCSFNDGATHYDIRRWNGELPLKGISLTDDEARKLKAALNAIADL